MRHRFDLREIKFKSNDSFTVLLKLIFKLVETVKWGWIHEGESKKRYMSIFIFWTFYSIFEIKKIKVISPSGFFGNKNGSFCSVYLHLRCVIVVHDFFSFQSNIK